MASGRVGGTRSKISGQVGSTVYQIRKNADGSYSQVVTAKGEQTVTFTTPRLQAQRMVTGMVESLMKQLKKVASISMQSAANKSKSLNAFSSFNLRLVAQDCKAHWYQDNAFVYPGMSNTKEYPDDLGGLYMISAGTLQFNLFDEYSDDVNWQTTYKAPYSWNDDFYSMRWHYSDDVETVGDFYKAYRITRLDTIVLCGFLAGQKNYDPETGDVEEFYKHLYIIMRPNPAVPDSALLTDDVIQSMFLIDANYDYRIAIRKDGAGFAIGWQVENYEVENLIPYMAGFSISYADGRKKISSSNYVNAYGHGGTWLNGHAPTDVFGTWIGEPWNRHYPSPF